MKPLADLAMAAAMAATMAAPAVTAAGTVMTEKGRIDGSEVIIWLHPFLQDDELATLRLVMTNRDALAIFVPQGEEAKGGQAKGGFAALAVSPDDGFIRNGAPVASAVALAGFASGEEAAEAAVKACDAQRKGKAPCVVALSVAPAP